MGLENVARLKFELWEISVLNELFEIFLDIESIMQKANQANWIYKLAL